MSTKASNLLSREWSLYAGITSFQPPIPYFSDEAVEVMDENAQSGGDAAVASNGSVPLRNSFDAIRLDH